MKKCLFVTNLPSPYRVDFFNELGKSVDLTVLYERRRSSERNEKWVGDKALFYSEVYADVKPYRTDQSIGSGILDYVKKASFDYLVITNYASPSIRKLIIWCIFHKIDYCLEYDGGFYKKDTLLKRIIKKFLITHAAAHFDSSAEHVRYLVDLGVKRERILKYPFSSIKESDIIGEPIPKNEKNEYRKKLKMSEKMIVLSVGQFIYRKGFDVLIRAASDLSKSIGFYFVGGTATAQSKTLIEELCLCNVHFVEFKTKDELSLYYKSSDLFVMPTREDIWGLVVNEAMSFGLPVISSNRCISGLEMVKPGSNGYIFENEKYHELARYIWLLFERPDALRTMGVNSIETARRFTIEKMVLAHLSYFGVQR